MATKFVCVVLMALCVLHTQNVSAHDRRDIGFPQINFLDPIGSIANFKDFIVNVTSGVIEAGKNAILTVENSKNALESLAGSVVESAKAEIGSLLNATITKIETAVRNSPIGPAVHVAECGGQGIKTAIADAAATVDGVVGCVVSQVNAIISPAVDLIAQSARGITLGSETFNNLTSTCFPNGFSTLDVLSIVPDLLCATAKFGDTISALINIVSNIQSDIQNFETSVNNTRNAVVRCPRVTEADLVIKFGNTITNFANCALGNNA
ncbi:uncharacterized protein LOC110831833 [Zootermopsis nevadensis]|uniref:Protein TsetseEP domain-containing protein n=1 Tax=Zootermopsis nevadensis TaxID=136037 RepID=A0A067R317_ZOONE|nr:uncharacterized protein LOC110831833 [Zootermopsis nevadensis]KDR17289.1 hypothetical protein L798_08855 [Zootermopsis nevadensis]